MSRWPAPGRCKRRLAASLGAPMAARIQQRLTGHTLAVARRCATATAPIETLLAVAGLGPRAAKRWAAALGADRFSLQGEGNLGLRMARQTRHAFREGARQVVLIGTDLPGLEWRDLQGAFAALERAPLVLGPALDGGYWLIGMNRFHPALFCGIAWGGQAVRHQTLEVAAGLALETALLPLAADLDRVGDLGPWQGPTV
ncbi:TIGR04282 family arsenosugar biosynthesis glycosyltransferase [Synechococcus sp. CS-603]|nr:TIGR04282 family arsenosugar biosynthesis glycosyltransferase [Synechococcus sp. CS-603]